MRWYLSQLAGILFLAGFVPYIIAIVRRQAQPMKATWLIWFAVDAISLAGMYVKDAVNGQIRGALIGSFIVLILSLRFGKRGWTKIERHRRPARRRGRRDSQEILPKIF